MNYDQALKILRKKQKSLAKEEAEKVVTRVIKDTYNAFEEDAKEEEASINDLNNYSKDVAEYIKDILKNIEKTF